MNERPTPPDPEFDNLIESRLRVLTWNIWWRYGPWQQRRPAIAATLRQLDPDVIALQEVWDDGAGNLAAELASELGYHHSYRSTQSRDGIGFGNAVLSRWPIARSDSRPLYGAEETGEGRGVVFAGVDGPRGAVPVFSTHLNWRFEHSHIRQKQVVDLARFVASMVAGSYPPILCGDFNAEPTSEEIRMLTGETTCAVEGLAFRDAWKDGGNGSPGYTWDNANPFARSDLEPNRRIDYLFVGFPKERGAGHTVHCRIVGDEPVDGIWPSDHFAVLADLRY